MTKITPDDLKYWKPYSPGEAEAIVAARDFDQLSWSHPARLLRNEAHRIGRIQFVSAGATRKR